MNLTLRDYRQLFLKGIEIGLFGPPLLDLFSKSAQEAGVTVEGPWTCADMHKIQAGCTPQAIEEAAALVGVDKLHTTLAVIAILGPPPSGDAGLDAQALQADRLAIVRACHSMKLFADEVMLAIEDAADKLELSQLGP